MEKLRLNNKKSKKFSQKVKTGDTVDLFNFDFKLRQFFKKQLKFVPTEEVIKENEDLIIDNNDDFIVLNKSSGISVQGGTKSKKNLSRYFCYVVIFFKIQSLFQFID